MGPRGWVLWSKRGHRERCATSHVRWLRWLEIGVSEFASRCRKMEPEEERQSWGVVPYAIASAPCSAHWWWGHWFISGSCGGPSRSGRLLRFVSVQRMWCKGMHVRARVRSIRTYQNNGIEFSGPFRASSWRLKKRSLLAFLKREARNVDRAHHTSDVTLCAAHGATTDDMTETASTPRRRCV